MGIDATWITETGERKQEVFDPRQCLTGLAANRWQSLHETKCLQFIDPWGDTLFNQGQIPYLIEELRREVENTQEPEVKAHLEKVVCLIESAVDSMHTYIRFVGD